MRLIIRVLLLLLLLGSGILLAWQNPLPLPLTLLGIKIQPASLGILLVGFIGLGCLTGGLLLLLFEGDRLLPIAARPRKRPAPPAGRPNRPNKTKPKTAKSRRPSSFFQNGGSSDWTEPIHHDWGGTATQANRKEYPRTPQEFWEEPPATSDYVVDADYRVLRPPTRRPRGSEWDDEFFDEP